MKKYLIYTIGLLTLTLLVGCNKDKDNTKYYEQEYPSTAIVLKQAVTDYDGNVYDAVQIGNQIWMASNLRATHFNDGTEMVDSYIQMPLYFRIDYDNFLNDEYISAPPIYGYYYDYADDKMCPTGWHIPSYEEWQELIAYVDNVYGIGGDYDGSGGARALAATCDWSSSNVPYSPGYNLSANNATGFSALPSSRYFTYSEWDPYEAYEASFWTNGQETSEWEVGDACIWYNESSVENNYATYGGAYPHHLGCCIRCIKD